MTTDPPYPTPCVGVAVAVAVEVEVAVAALVPIVALTEDMLVSRDGAFVNMLEMPPLDIAFADQHFGRWFERCRMALERLPPVATFQLTVLLEPHDPTLDMKSFLRNWVNFLPPLTDRKDRYKIRIRRVAGSNPKRPTLPTDLGLRFNFEVQL